MVLPGGKVIYRPFTPTNICWYVTTTLRMVVLKGVYENGKLYLGWKGFKDMLAVGVSSKTPEQFLLLIARILMLHRDSNRSPWLLSNF